MAKAQSSSFVSSAHSFSSSTRGEICGVQLTTEKDMGTQLLSLLAAVPTLARLTQAERVCPSAACRTEQLSLQSSCSSTLLRALLTASWHPNNLAPLPSTIQARVAFEREKREDKDYRFKMRQIFDSRLVGFHTAS